MAEDAKTALDTLKQILDAQESALKKQGKEIERLQSRDSELSGHILKLNKRAEEANERLRTLEEEADRQARDNEVLQARADGLARELASTTENLTAQANAAEQQVQLLEDRCRSLKEKADYGERMKFAGEKLDDATERVRELEVRCAALQVKADDYDDVVAAASKLVIALSKLPLDMKDAAMIPNAVRPKIELYGTYDWQQAMDAKLALEAELRKGA